METFCNVNEILINEALVVSTWLSMTDDVTLSLSAPWQWSSLYLTPSCSRAASLSPSQRRGPSTASPSSPPLHVLGWTRGRRGSRASHLCWPRPCTSARTAGRKRAPRGGPIWATSVEACLVEWGWLRFKERGGEEGEMHIWGRESEEEEEETTTDGLLSVLKSLKYTLCVFVE